MAWNPSPRVADCRDIGRKWNSDIVVILGVNTRTGKYEVASFGETRELCAIAKRINDKIADMMQKGQLP